MARVIVPIAILKRQSVSNGLINLFGTMDVTVLGYHVIPEQTDPDQARLQYEKRAIDALEDIAEEFRQAGGEADYRLVFTHRRKQTIQRVADETDSQAFAIPETTGPIKTLLLPLSGHIAIERILSFVVELIGNRDLDVTLFLVSGDESDEAQERLDTAADVLTEHGIDVRMTLETDTTPFAGLIDGVAGHDAIVMGEQAPSFRSSLFGDETERIATESVGPVLVVRRN
jgi:nucleotide-binding universal stress UspA family protein